MENSSVSPCSFQTPLFCSTRGTETVLARREVRVLDMALVGGPASRQPLVLALQHDAEAAPCSGATRLRAV